MPEGLFLGAGCSVRRPLDGSGESVPEGQLRQTSGRHIIRSLYCSGDELDFLGVGELAPPARKSARLGFVSVLLQFEKPQEQIPQGGHDVSAVAPADSRSVLAQADIPAVVRPVFTGRPVVTNYLQQLLGAVLPLGGTGAVEAIFFRFLSDFALAQLFSFPPHRHKLPATAQAGFFGTKADSLDAPAHQAPVLFGPAGVVFRGKKKLWGA